MHSDIVELRSFYGSPIGRTAAKAIGETMAATWRPYPEERLLGFGYTLPWLRRFGDKAERALAFMPAGQGAHRWPRHEPSMTALVFEEELPLPDASIDRVLMVHALEHAQSPRDTLNEFWRVLAPNGRLVVVVPNRRGLWARFEHTPFGTGRPFSSGQIKALLREANFTVETVTEALHAPPFKRRWSMRMTPLFETLGKRFWPIFSGVLIVEARKQVYQGLPVAERRSRRVFVPVLSPQGAAMRSTSRTP